jgi:hypothetical protein
MDTITVRIVKEGVVEVAELDSEDGALAESILDEAWESDGVAESTPDEGESEQPELSIEELEQFFAGPH